jgi:hypothetical protein
VIGIPAGYRICILSCFVRFTPSYKTQILSERPGLRYKHLTSSFFSPSHFVPQTKKHTVQHNTVVSRDTVLHVSVRTLLVTTVVVVVVVVVVVDVLPLFLFFFVFFFFASFFTSFHARYTHELTVYTN